MFHAGSCCVQVQGMGHSGTLQFVDNSVQVFLNSFLKENVAIWSTKILRKPGGKITCFSCLFP